MKPIRLEIAGFLSYRNVEIIDFETLGKQGLYLITGDTGAGKTTIFDAIMYALYGESSGSSRTSDSLRSKYCTEDDPTYVKFTFEVDGEEFTIHRNPAYRGKSDKRKGAYKQYDADVTLYFSDGRAPVNKDKNVKNVISQIIGLESGQFKNIVMISQGEFSKFLKADTKEKERIFRTVFDTNNYLLLQERIKKDYKECDKQKQDNNKTLMLYVKEIKSDDDRIVSYQDNTIFSEDILPVLEEINKQNEVILKDCTEEIKQLDDQIRSLEKEKAIAEKNEKDKKALKENKEWHKVLEGRVQEALQQKKEAESKQPIIDAKVKEKTILENQMQEYNDLDENKWIFNECCKKEKELYDNQSQQQYHLEVLEKRIKDNQDELQSYALVEAALVTNINDLKQIENEEKQLQSLQGKNEKLNETIKKHIAVSEKVTGARSIYETLDREYKEMFKAFNDEQAGILAEELVKEEEEKNCRIPCPVCGSLEHPHLAVKSIHAPSQEKLKEKKDQVDEAHNNYLSLCTQCSSLKSTRDSEEEQVLEMAKELLEIDVLKEFEQAFKTKEMNIVSRKKELKSEKNELSKKSKRMEELKVTIPKDEGTMKKGIQQMESIKNDIQENEVKKSVAEKNVERLRESLKYESKDEAQKEINKISYEIKMLNEDIEKTANKYTELSTNKSKIEGQIQQLQENLKNADTLDLTSIKDSIRKMSSLKEEKNTYRDMIHANNQNNQEKYVNISKVYNNQKSVLAKHRWLSALNDVATGQNSDNGKMTLETFVQTFYFDQVLAKANKRFLVMSDNQYTMERKKESNSKASHYGLEIMIKDHYNNSLRDVGSLSGGESFKASLSLALGLSDLIQESAKGKRLDSMFIDEGFGSLDTTSLRQAINELQKLSDGKRIVGIISHVNELKNMIDDKIIVTKDSSGYSKTKIERGI